MKIFQRILLLSLLLAACQGPEAKAPFAQSQVPPSLAPRFHAPDGWAWGLVGVGDAPPQRYGVSAPFAPLKAQVLILPGYGEPAEAWFETARDLNARGFSVWLLERAGQGGSARQAQPRDLGHVASFDPDVAATKAMVRAVMRPLPGRPTVLIGDGIGAVVALRAVQEGLRVDGLILSSPDLDEGSKAALAAGAGLGRVRAPGQSGWTREGPDAFALGRTHDLTRGAVPLAWQLANPDLRMGGPSLGWLRAAEKARAEALAKFSRTPGPVLVIGPESSRISCAALPRCAATPIKGAGKALYLEDDTRRGPWLAAIEAFVGQRIDE